MNFYIENYKPEHKNSIINVWEKSVLATHHFLKHDDFLQIKTMLQDFDFNILQTYSLMINNQVVGFIGIQENKLEMLFLNPEYFQQGLGRKLMDFAFTNHKIEFVDVNEQNINAVQFYNKLGFETFEKTKRDDLGMNYPILKMKLNKTK